MSIRTDLRDAFLRLNDEQLRNLEYHATAEIEVAFEGYRQACYGDQELPELQLKEVRQAFLSGIHWQNTRDGYCPDETTRSLRTLLSGHFPTEDGE